LEQGHLTHTKASQTSENYREGKNLESSIWKTHYLKGKKVQLPWQLISHLKPWRPGGSRRTFLFFSSGAWTQDLYFEPPLCQLFFCDGFFRDRISRTVSSGWLQTANFLTSASRAVTFTGVSHWHLAKSDFLFFFGGSRVWIQDFTLAKQMLYHLKQTSSPPFLFLHFFSFLVQGLNTGHCVC
jgi:hypothetical protein